jgi:hypothetical protein
MQQDDIVPETVILYNERVSLLNIRKPFNVALSHQGTAGTLVSDGEDSLQLWSGE